MDKKYNDVLLAKLEKVGQIAKQMTDADAAYLAGRLDGVLDSQRKQIAVDPKRFYESEAS